MAHLTTTGTGRPRLSSQALDLLFRQARTPGGFTDEPVGPEDLRALYELIRHGPTSFNQQPLRVLEIRSTGARQRLLRHLTDRNRDKARGAPLTLLLAVDLNYHEHLPVVFPHAPHLYEWLANAPEVRRERGRFDALLQTGYLIVAARALGLAALPMLGFDEAGLNAEFFPAGDREALLVLNLGRPAPVRRERLPRLTYDQVVTTL
ncbi:malonic semialdehyde reductase [Streptomyces sp. MST-110588]|uniref:malonic semialdehyde reductase n=1 Tax=Streptomyces sp. MST-110588 TaxID=2833628 RepID=UPI001F5D8DEC|nr:malonic semialdehyde reductase [Streptomyces sp. MST-110588]UNO40798.1 malonic semialdehyde reductase [Streptomyces sp. MST-110588]